MFGVYKCFGGSSWGHIMIVSDFKLAEDICVKLKEKGGLYKVKPVQVFSDTNYICKELDIILD